MFASLPPLRCEESIGLEMLDGGDVLDFFVIVFAWTVLCMKVELMSQGEKGAICELRFIAAILQNGPDPLHKAPSCSRRGLPERGGMLTKAEAWFFIFIFYFFIYFL